MDDRRPAKRSDALAMLTALDAEVAFGGAHRVGITGAPGAGKSTLLDALVRRRRAADATVGVIAVDPSSQQSGGALLGDRVRVRGAGRDPGVFFRSLAARDQLGGLAESARAAVTVLGAAFDLVIVESVGVGQSEGEIADLVDTLVYVGQPGAGDLLQFMKAGILELPDCFAVNKADLGPVATRTAQELSSGLGLAARRPGAWVAPVVCVSARDGTGLDELDAAIDAHRAHLAESGEGEARRRAGRDAGVRAALARRYGSYGLEAIGGREELAKRLAGDPAGSGFAWIARLGREIEAALATGRPG